MSMEDGKRMGQIRTEGEMALKNLNKCLCRSRDIRSKCSVPAEASGASMCE
jgi:hypothetical protein